MNADGWGATGEGNVNKHTDNSERSERTTDNGPLTTDH